MNSIETDDGSASTGAGWWQRAVATAVDLLITLTPVAIVFVAMMPGPDDAEAAVRAAVVAAGVYLTVVLLYAPPLMAREGRHNGQTLGKQMMGIRTVRENGQPFGLGAGVLREILVKQLLLGLGYFLFLVPNVVDVLWPLWDRKHQALHDKLVSTRVLRCGVG